MAADRNEQIESLITRLVDGAGDDGDWRAFERLADRDALVWRRLASDQWLNRRLCDEVGDELGDSAEVELDQIATAPTSGWRLNGQRIVNTVVRNAGWAAAAALAIAWAITLNPGATSNTNGPVADSKAPQATNTPDVLLASYLDSPHVVGEAEPVLLQRIDADGAQEIVYLRRIIERQRVSRTLQPAWDENANLVFTTAPASEVIRASY